MYSLLSYWLPSVLEDVFAPEQAMFTQLSVQEKSANRTASCMAGGRNAHSQGKLRQFAISLYITEGVTSTKSHYVVKYSAIQD